MAAEFSAIRDYTPFNTELSPDEYARAVEDMMTRRKARAAEGAA